MALVVSVATGVAAFQTASTTTACTATTEATSPTSIDAGRLEAFVVDPTTARRPADQAGASSVTTGPREAVLPTGEAYAAVAPDASMEDATTPIGVPPRVVVADVEASTIVVPTDAHTPFGTAPPTVRPSDDGAAPVGSTGVAARIAGDPSPTVLTGNYRLGI